jgi:hypothetical protein
MTEPIVCKKGKCGYENQMLDEEWKNVCSDCDILEKIEHDLLEKDIRPRKRTI